MPTKRKMVHVYVTPEEKELIELRAGEKSMSVSKWLLYLALNSDKASPVEKREVVSKPDRTDDREIPPPPSDGIQRGFVPHPPKIAGGKA